MSPAQASETVAQAKADQPPPQPAACDVLVIGGGPGGSTIASLLVEKGWNVALLEKDHHPKFHIGESLLPMNLPILERLGVLEQVREIGIVKPGVEMCSDRLRGKSQMFYFDRMPDGIPPHAFQVLRSEFDHLLLRNSAKRGVEVHEGLRVTEVAFRPGETSLVSAENGTGERQVWETGFVVDASGRDAFLSTRLGLKEKDRRHNSVALFGHFKNAERRSGRDEGNIGLYWFEHGWFWMIPLRDDVMSVGAVCWPDYLKTRRTDLEDFLWDTIHLCPGVHDRMKQAELIGPASATGNFSYRSRRMWGDGYLLVGDAYAFVDPVFSSGVYLAMNSALLGAEVVDACLRKGRPDVRLLKAFEDRVQRGLRTLSWFIYRFTTPAIHNLFMAPRNFLGVEQAVLSMLAGDVFRKTRLTLPIMLFKSLYYLTAGLNWGRSWTSLRRRRRNVGLDFTERDAAE
jgi:flavin-dependent dehydrogenase